jgi:hypothetical protein
MNIDEQCWVCGKPERFNVCVECGVDIINNFEVDRKFIKYFIWNIIYNF